MELKELRKILKDYCREGSIRILNENEYEVSRISINRVLMLARKIHLTNGSLCVSGENNQDIAFIPIENIKTFCVIRERKNNE